MNLFELLILLLFFLAPTLSRMLRKERPGLEAPPQTEPRPAHGEPAHGEEDPFGEALRQIREALGEPVPPPEPTPRPEPVPESRRMEKARPEPAFRGPGASEHEERGFGLSSPVSEEIFEQRPISARPSGTKPIRKTRPKRPDLPLPLEVKKLPAGTGPQALVRLLRDPQRAREALILHEVLGLPRSRSRSR